MSFDKDLIAVIDQRVRLAQQTTRAVGVCVERDGIGPGAQVLFDGSTIAMPVKVLENVSVQPGIRCVLDKYGTDWFVTGAWSAYQLGNSTYHNTGSASNGTTSSSYSDVAQVPPVAFTKYYDNTNVRMASVVSAFATLTNTVARFGIRLTPQSGQAYTAHDYDVSIQFLNTAGVHMPNVGWARYSGIPAGDYLWQLRFLRVSGTGTVTVNTDDAFTIELDEYVDAGSPIL